MNNVEFEVTGRKALFTFPEFKTGGEKSSMAIPTYEALKGILKSIYWKPTITWIIDEVRVMNPFRMEASGKIIPKMKGNKNDMALYNYLRDCRYQVRAHFIFNKNHPECRPDWNEKKHLEISKRMIEKGGRQDIFLGTRECQGYVKPCKFGEGIGFFDNYGDIPFGLMYHGLTYPDEAYSKETQGCITMRMWCPVMHNGVIKFIKPEDCVMTKVICKMQPKTFEMPKERKSRLEVLIYRTFLSTEIKTKCRDKKDYKRRNIVGLLQKLIKTYDVMADKYAGVYIDGMREPLAPVSHALQNAQIEITIDSNGCFIDAAAVPKKENRTLIPVSLKSANRTSHASPHPFAEQLEYLSGFDEERQKSYLEQLMDWDESAYGNAFTHAVHTYVEKNSIIHDLYKAEVLESENEEDMSKKKMQSTAYKKCLVRWKIKDVLTGEVIETWKSKEMFRCYIAYYNMVIAKESKTGLCMLTGENVPLTELHAKNIFPLQSGAKLVSANDKTEYTFRGTFVKNAEDLLTIGYEASQKSHNMLRWLLNNFGIIAGNEMFVYWNPNGRYVPSPFEDRKEGDEIISDRETLYRSIFESTEDNSLSSTDCIVIAAFKAMTTGRLSLAYYSETPGNDFVAKL